MGADRREVNTAGARRGTHKIAGLRNYKAVLGSREPPVRKPTRWRLWATLAALTTTFVTTTVTGVATHVTNWMFDANANRSSAAPPAPSSINSATRINYFSPWGFGGVIAVPNAQITFAQAPDATCWASSLITTTANAYRCDDNNLIMDPCWASGSDYESDVACASSPWSRYILIIKNGLSGVPTRDVTLTREPLVSPWAMIISDPENPGETLDCAAIEISPETVAAGMNAEWNCFAPKAAGDENPQVSGAAFNNLTEGSNNFRAVYYRPNDSPTLVLTNVLAVW